MQKERKKNENTRILKITNKNCEIVLFLEYTSELIKFENI